MSGPPYDVVGAAAYAVAALVWIILSGGAWRLRIGLRPRAPLYRLLPFMATAVAAFYVLYVAVALCVPAHGDGPAPRWFELTDLAMLVAMACFRHVTWYLPLDAPRASRRWVVPMYVGAVGVGLASVVPELIPAATPGDQRGWSRIALGVYTVVVSLAVLRDVWRFARPGGWRAGGPAVARVADLPVIGLAVAGVGGLFVLITLWARAPWTEGFLQPPPIPTAAVGLVTALPFVVRVLGDMLKRLLFLTLIGAVALGERAVETHGGRIAVDSTPGAGTTLRVDLPLAGPSA